MEVKKAFRLIASIIICQFAGIIGSVFTIQAIPTWYAGLAKPFFAPPNWVFGPVWITLYFLMGLSLYFAWENGLVKPKAAPIKKKAKLAITLFGIQLALNALWSYLFFGLRNPLLGLIEVIILWLSIAATIIAIYPVSKKSAILLIPYIAWVSIATTLNASLYLLNP